ncbi:2OG-Fe(II) oxygenase [Wandonia haliotis]|uniref:2OG-Fe(II) oxygenase n=1 Tax=Wandonia haliotis TaxID=574963 RepID=A0ABP3Y763_9FLAO
MYGTDLNPLYEEIISGLINENFAVFDGFFDENMLEALTSRLEYHLEEERLRTAGIGNKELVSIDKQIRSDKILWLKDHPEHPVEKEFMDGVAAFSEYMNRTCFAGIQGGEFHYACYEEGAFYKRHIDRFMNDNSRKYSIITYLNKDWQPEDGGELVLYLEDRTLLLRPEFGKTILFKSDLIEHEVLPAKRRRLSITGWLK